MNTPNTTVPKHNMTNKLLVVGHPYSNLDFVLDVMQKCNVSAAKKLEKEGIEAQEISQILLKAHGVDPEFTQGQVQVNSVWNGLAMDLMMSNLEHSKWVWADSDALTLLDYWKSLDNSLAFVLVYNSPQKSLQELIESSALDFEDELGDALQRWQNYNRAMLNFFYRNQERCLLVNSEQVEENSHTYLQEIGKQIGLHNEEITNTLEIVDAQKQSSTQGSDLFEYFVSQIVDKNEQVKQLYMELESIANLPSLKYENKNYSLDKVLSSYVLEQKEYQSVCSKLESSQKNYNETQKQKEELSKQLEQESEKVQETQSENELLLTHLMNIQEEMEKIYIEKAAEEKKVKNLVGIQELGEENKLLLEQLHLVQEEPEKYYLENLELKKSLEHSKKQYGAADRVKQQLSYRLGAKMIEKSKSFGGTVGLPFTLYGEVKRFRKEKKTQKKLLPIYIYADAHEAERVKKHLSYRLGQATIESMKSPFGVLKIPFALKRAHREYKEERK